MAEDYRDPRIEADANGLKIKHYYVPFGAKHVAWNDIQGVGRIKLSTLGGRLRVWGTSNPRYWTNLDPRRPVKKQGFVIDLGRRVRPFITPDDPAAFEAAVRSHSSAPIEDSRVLIV
jgi:hypothetical protein